MFNNIENVKTIRTPEELGRFIKNLHDIYENKKGLYFFRGLKNSSYELLAGAFRPGDIRFRELLFNHSKAHNLAYTDTAKKIVLMHCNGNSELYKQFMGDDSYKRIINIIDFITRYNFHASSFVDENRAIYDASSVEALSYRPPNCWLTDEFFYGALDGYLRGLAFQLSLDEKEVLKEPYILNDLTPYDESLAQHYCGRYPTTILDWTYNPYVALYFALPTNYKNSIFFSLCVCEKPTQNDRQIFFIENHQEFNGYNLRIKRQEGLFSQIKPPVSFYYHKGFWPSIEALINFDPSISEYIHITRYNIAVSLSDNVRIILNNIEKNKYNNDFLLPELESPL